MTKQEKINSLACYASGGDLVMFRTHRGGRFHNPGFKEFKGFSDISQIEEYGYSVFWETDEDDMPMYGEETPITDCSGNDTGCTYGEWLCGVGTLDFDGDYDKWESKKLEDCDEGEVRIIVESRDPDADACLRYFLENDYLDWDEDDDFVIYP